MVDRPRPPSQTGTSQVTRSPDIPSRHFVRETEPKMPYDPIRRKYWPRVADGELKRRLARSGAVLIEGPRACGKTASARRIAASSVMLDADPSARRAAAVDPGFLLQGATPRLIDEWQLVPDIWNHVRHAVDDRSRSGPLHPDRFGSPARRHHATYRGGPYRSVASAADVAVRTEAFDGRGVRSGGCWRATRSRVARRSCRCANSRNWHASAAGPSIWDRRKTTPHSPPRTRWPRTGTTWARSAARTSNGWTGREGIRRGSGGFCSLWAATSPPVRAWRRWPGMPADLTSTSPTTRPAPT